MIILIQTINFANSLILKILILTEETDAIINELNESLVA